MAYPRIAAETGTDQEFIRQLRECVARYFRALDAWEAGYHKFYRMAGSHFSKSPDLEEARLEYVAARGELAALSPRARRLCARFSLRDPWPGLLRIELGAHPPQVRTASAIGRSERLAITDCLANLELNSVQWEEQHAVSKPPPAASAVQHPRRNILQRIFDWFI